MTKPELLRVLEPYVCETDGEWLFTLRKSSAYRRLVS